MSQKKQKRHIPERYLTSGHVVDVMDSRVEWGNTEEDHIIKRIVLYARNGEIACKEDKPEAIVLVVMGECDVLNDNPAIPGEKYITDTRVEFFRIPFPYDPKVRRAIIASIRKYPSLFWKV